MPTFGPINRVRLIQGLRALGFEGPYPAGRHAFMVRKGKRLTIPNPHRGDIGVGLLAAVLRQAGVSREEWEAV
jgi:predicted RNA binding protein YcfA (HicA-like mRNA interferase family)